MDIGKIFPVVIVALMAASCNSPVTERDEKQPVSSVSTSPTKSQQEEGTTTQEHVLPDREETEPAPELTPEERERLIRGTEIEESPSKENPCNSSTE